MDSGCNISYALLPIFAVVMVIGIFLFLSMRKGRDAFKKINAEAESPQPVPTNDAKGNTYAGKARAESHDEARYKSSDSSVDTVITAAVVANVLSDDDCEESSKTTQTNRYEDNSKNSNVEVRTDTTDTSDYSSGSSGGGDW
jgi:hypothetical protein